MNRTLANETNGLEDGHSYHAAVDYKRDLSLKEIAEAGGKISRVRIFIEGRMADLSYMHATLADGTIVSVNTAYLRLSNSFTIKRDLIEWAKSQGVFAKGLGLLDEGNWSVLR